MSYYINSKKWPINQPKRYWTCISGYNFVYYHKSLFMSDIDAMIEGLKVTTLAVREAIKKGLCVFTYEDGTKVEADDYVWDESQFPIEVISDNGKITVNKQAIRDWYNGKNGK